MVIYMPTITCSQIQSVIARSMIGRQNAHKRSARKDAYAALRDPSNRACVEVTSMRWHQWFNDPSRMPVVRCDASPMNGKRKVLILACGHEVWASRKTKFSSCQKCADDQKEWR